MKSIKDMLVNGFNIVYCDGDKVRYGLYQKFVVENPEYDFDTHSEFWDRRKRGLLYRAPSAFKILKKNKEIRKRHRTAEMIKILKELDMYYLADRIPNALRDSERVMFSIAWDILETGRETFVICENGGYYTKESLAFIASRIYNYSWENDIRFLWITSSAPNTEDVLKSCDNLLEYKDGELIKHNAKDALNGITKKKKSSGSLFERVEAALNKEPAPVEKVIPPIKKEVAPIVNEPVKTVVTGSTTPKLISKDHIPILGKVCRLSDGTEGVVISQHYGPIRNFDKYEFSIRELKNGNVSLLSVMWSKDNKNTNYSSFYRSTYPRQGAEEKKIGDFIGWYEQNFKNVEYESYDAELRYCTYLGNNLCKDMFTGDVYRPELCAPVIKELENVKVGGVVSVCLYCGKIYFGGSYRTEKFVALFAPDKSGVLRYYDASHYGLLYTNKVYTEKNGKLTTADPQKGNMYILTRIAALDGHRNDMYRGGGESVSWIVPAKGETRYGLLKGQYDEKFKSKSVTFTPFNEEKSYRVNKEVVSDRFFDVLCERDIPAKAEVFDVDCNLAIPSSQPLERKTLSYGYLDGNTVVCIDPDTYEISEIPCSLLPTEITEGCTFYYYPEIKYAVLVSTLEPGNEEPTEEPVVTYNGFDSKKDVHVIRTAGKKGPAFESLYGADDVKFVDKDIKKGDRVDMRFSFNEEKNRLEVYLTKYKG